MPLRLINPEKSRNFMGLHKVGFALSLLLIVASIGLLVTKGLQFGIDFTGGMVMEMRLAEPVPLSELRTAVVSTDIGQVTLQHFGSDRDVMLRVQAAEGGEQQALVAQIKDMLATAVPVGIEYRKVDYVGPQVGEELVEAGVMALGFSFLAMLLYIWFRFEWQFGMGAIIALIHDAILTLGFFALLGLEFNLASIAAILTIIGYSINDSVVIYDRVRENLRKYKKMPLSELLNVSINDTLSRTLLTAGTTIVALLALVLFGGAVIRDFSMAILFGVVIGTYSSIFIAAPLLQYMGLRRSALSGAEDTANASA